MIIDEIEIEEVEADQEDGKQINRILSNKLILFYWNFSNSRKRSSETQRFRNRSPPSPKKSEEKNATEIEDLEKKVMNAKKLLEMIVKEKESVKRSSSRDSERKKRKQKHRKRSSSSSSK